MWNLIEVNEPNIRQSCFRTQRHTGMLTSTLLWLKKNEIHTGRRLNAVVMPGICTIQGKNDFEVLRKTGAHPGNGFISLLLRLKTHPRQAASGRAPTYLKGDSWAWFYCCPVWDFPSSPWIPQHRTHLGVHLSQASEMQKAQSWWESPALRWLMLSPSTMLSQGSRSSNTGVMWEEGPRDQSTALQISCIRNALHWPIPPQYASHRPAWNQGPQSSSAHVSPRSMEPGPPGPLRLPSYSWGHLLISYPGGLPVVNYKATMQAQVSWPVGQCFFPQCKLQQILNQKFKPSSKVSKIQ